MNSLRRNAALSRDHEHAKHLNGWQRLMLKREVSYVPPRAGPVRRGCQFPRERGLFLPGVLLPALPSLNRRWGRQKSRWADSLNDLQARRDGWKVARPGRVAPNRL